MSTSFLRGKCVDEYAYSNDDPAYCSAIGRTDAGANYRDDCYYRLAVKLNDSALCEKMDSDDSSTYKCRGRFAKDLSVCRGIANSHHYSPFECIDTVLAQNPSSDCTILRGAGSEYPLMDPEGYCLGYSARDMGTCRDLANAGHSRIYNCVDTVLRYAPNANCSVLRENEANPGANNNIQLYCKSKKGE